MSGHTGGRDHWESIYATRGREAVSWFESAPATSARLILGAGVPESVIDVGAGASSLADSLLDAGVRHVTLLDLSLSALASTSARLAERASAVTTIAADLLTHPFDETYDVWHDRAVFHFLTQASERAAYAGQLARALRPGGRLVIGTFAADGPDSCSGLPVVGYSAEGLATELVDVLGLPLEVTTAERVEHRTPSGAVQPFTWLVLTRPG